jgi:two-component system chemotaxis sensor kinase CheA
VKPDIKEANDPDRQKLLGQPEPQSHTQTIRVSVDVLETLMVLVSELVLTRNQLLQLSRTDENQLFSVPLQRLSHITSDLQEGIMKTRMQPIGNAWAKLPRLVRDLGQELGKKIHLDLRGADTELDRQVLELIRDPITHMVRNSGDHGLESPEERRALGKPEAGVILLNAYHEGGHIMIEVSDDGRGLSIPKIRAKAASQGLATETELASLSDREVARFIFQAGLSTAGEVTAVSGRGVGMDVVKTNIEKIGGTIEVQTEIGKGTKFFIKIPLTLAIVSALIVESGGERFAVPQIGVVELVRVGGGDGGPKLERIHDTPVLRLRDKLLPLVSLSGLLHLDTPEPEAAGFVVVTQVGQQVFGIIVDRVFDTEEIVVKPVAPILRNITIFSGNTILGDGSVIMILDQNGIARAAGVGTGPTNGDGQVLGIVPQHTTAKTSLLLFRAGDKTPKAVPLALVGRLEDIERTRIEEAGGRPIVQYREKLMPIVPMNPDWSLNSSAERLSILVFAESGRVMGLMVDEILDVVDEQLIIDIAGARPGILGSVIVNGRLTELVDTAWWLKQAGEGWFGCPNPVKNTEKISLLVVEDSVFFRNLVVPSLLSAGFDVVAVSNAREALRLRDGGAMFDAIVSDIEMPELDGLALARSIRDAGPWQNLPLIALTGRQSPADLEAGRSAGFTDYVVKFDQDRLVASVRECLAAVPAI